VSGPRDKAACASVGWGLVAVGAMALVRAWLAAEPPPLAHRIGAGVELRLDALQGDEFRLLPGVGPVLAGAWRPRAGGGCACRT
jgi:hypothetical protein